MVEKVRLCDVCDFQGGSQPPKNEWSFEQKDGYIRMLQIRDFTQTRNVEKEYIKLTSSTKTCVTEDILIARYGASIGKILTGLSGAYNVAIMKTIPNEGILNKSYLKYYLLSNYFQNGINSVGARAAQAGFNKEDLSKLYIPVVSLVQQKLIVDKLNKLTTFIGKRKTQLEKLDELVKSRFVEMFGDCKSMVSMNELCSIITDGTHQPPRFQESGIPFIFVSNLVGNVVTYNAEKFISEDTYAELYKRTPIEIGDLLLSTVGSYGHPAVVTEDRKFLFQRHIAYLKPRHNMVNSFYLHSALLAPDGQRQIEEKVKGIAQKTLNLSEIKKIVVPLPTIEEQNQFEKFVNQIDKSKFEIKQSLEKLELLKKALMQKYFG